MKPIAVYYHCLFELGDPPEVLPQAVSIVHEQMTQLRVSGLLDAATKFVVGINGGAASREIANLVIPPKAEIIMHGLESRAENLTILEIEKFIKDHRDWNVLYFHSKGATHTAPDFTDRWRNCMVKNCVTKWFKAVQELETHDAVGCHWMTGMGNDHSQRYFAGNFWWATSNFLAKLPSLHTRGRIRESGIAALESRWESEVWIGNGPTPKIKDLEPKHKFNECP